MNATTTTPQRLKDAAAGNPQSQAPARRSILDYLGNPAVQKGIAAVAGKYLTADRMMRLCVNAVKKTPKLLECDPQTVLGAMMASAALGLEPNTVQQQAFLIPYKAWRKDPATGKFYEVYDCQFQVGARGFITLAYRSPLIQKITSHAIRDGDIFEHEEGSSAFLRYRKTLADRGRLLGSFCYVQMTNGAQLACVLPLDEVLKIRGKSETYRSLYRNVEQAKNDQERAKAQLKFDEQPWVMWEDDMAAKSATKKEAKELPIASNDALAIAAELDNKSDSREGRLDLRAFTDPDQVRDVMDGAAGGVPTLEHSEPETLETGSGEAFGQTAARQAETVERKEGGEGPAAAAKTTPAKTPAAKSSKASNAGGKPEATASSASDAESPTYAEVAERIKNAKNADSAAAILDSMRGQFSEELLVDLGGVYRTKWSNKQ